MTGKAWRRRMSLVGATIFLAVVVMSPLFPARAEEKYERRGDIVIQSDAEFDADHGIRSGSGTKDDPYVISGWDVSQMILKDTSRYVVIRNNRVSGRMVLDWNGDRLTVAQNDVGDLRVNQNVERTGAASSGVIAHNKFRVVGQLRHWDGVFAHNKVGTEDFLSKHLAFKAVQFDGFNGSRFVDNVIFGYVDAKLHGHHHSSQFGDHSHYHGSGHEAHMGHENHTRRHHQVWISGNKIVSTYRWGLRYYDLAHTADDRTAASETDKFLNCPHYHLTKVHMTKNKLIGAGIAVDVFNADDENHLGTKTGLVEISGNEIVLDRDLRDLSPTRNGIVVQQARDLKLRIEQNDILGADQVEAERDILGLESKLNTGAGIRLVDLDDARVYLTRNWVAHRQYGVSALRFTRSVQWWIRDLATDDVERDVYYEEVSNPPN